jgi:molybdenum cofactor biosynthesis protein MoaC
MRNISDKISTRRTATAMSVVKMDPETVILLKNNDLPKKDVLIVARVAGITAAKKTPDLIPYCHSLPLDSVEISYEVRHSEVVVSATATAIWKTGVEMEALLAASVAALTVYDMLKPIDDAMEITATKLVEKIGGKSDFVESLHSNFKAAVIVTSDGTFQGKREDKSGKIIRNRLRSMGIESIAYVILPDEEVQIRNELLKLCEEKIDLIVTTGGTGLGPRDVTVEATRGVIEREMPAVMQAVRDYGQTRTPYAMLSRGLAGARGKSVILNLPGSSRGTEESLNAVFPALLHVYKMMDGGGH